MTTHRIVSLIRQLKTAMRAISTVLKWTVALPFRYAMQTSFLLLRGAIISVYDNISKIILSKIPT